MAISSDPLPVDSSEQRLSGQSVAFIGKLVGMTRDEACKAVVTEGAEVVSGSSPAPTLVVISDGLPDLASAVQDKNSVHLKYAEDVACGRAILIRESELWSRLGLIDEKHGVKQLYTPAMLAELLEVPIVAIRRWHRRGVLIACHSVRRLPYFDFVDVAVARHLAALLKAGCTLHTIDRKLIELKRCMPEVGRPLCDPSIVVSSGRLFVRRGEELTEPGGQRLIDFDTSPGESQKDFSQPLLSIAGHSMASSEEQFEGSVESLSAFDEMQLEAQDWEDRGELQRAEEIYRTMLVAGGSKAELHFALADLLYRAGDLSAARERYYVAIELDEEYVEARANLGSVLVENDELDLAVAAFQGALAFHPDYADVHYHLAHTLDRLGRPGEAMLHWQAFLALAPESPWAEAARERLETDSKPVRAASTT